MIVVPTTPQDVSRTLLLAQQYQLDIAVRGGGHASSGASSSDGGVVIDLGQMRTVSVDSLNQKVTVGGGAIWEDVDRAAAKHGLACVGGTVNEYAFPTPSLSVTLSVL